MKTIDSITSFNTKPKDSIFDQLRKSKTRTFWQKVGDLLGHHDQVDCFFGNFKDGENK